MVDDWQAIDSAPKDGTEVLLFHPQSNEMFVAFWSREVRRWQYAVAPGGSLIVLAPGVTHWQPLPPPPVLDKTT